MLVDKYCAKSLNIVKDPLTKNHRIIVVDLISVQGIGLPQALGL